MFQEQCEGLLEEEESDNEEEQELPSKLQEEEEEKPEAGPALVSPLSQAVVREKKTERQRKKEKEAKRLVGLPVIRRGWRDLFLIQSFLSQESFMNPQ